MKRRLALPALALAMLMSAVSPVLAVEEADRLFMVGEQALADRFFPVARRTLERFVAQYPGDARQPRALLMLGKARVALNDPQAALDAIRRAQSGLTSPAETQEAMFWQAEALFRLRRFGEARAAYDEIVRTDAAGPLAPDAVYGVGLSQLELKRAEPAVTAFREFLSTWPDHALAPAVTLQLARALVEARHAPDALTLLAAFAATYPGSPKIADAQFLAGWVKFNNGDPRGGLANLKEFVAANPTHGQTPAARRLIAQWSAKYGDRDEMLESYKALLDQEPPTADALYEAAQIAARLARAKDQDTAWKKLHAQFPDHPLTRQLARDLANAAFKHKRWKDASALGQIAAQSEEAPVRAEGLLTVGESELQLGRFPQAAKAFEAVGAIADVEADPRYRALAGLGLAREQQREWKAALAAYEIVADRSPDATLRDWARARVAAVKGQLKKSSNGAPATPKPGKRASNRS